MTTHIEYIKQAASTIIVTHRAERIARGSPSRGVGSGSRMRRFVCDCTPPVIVRTARDSFDAMCHHCTGEFHV